MGEARDRLQLALREWRGSLALPLVIWAVATLLCAIAGPFGTHDAMGLAMRLVYWGLVAGISVIGSALMFRVEPEAPAPRVALWVGFTLALTLVIYGLNALLFDGWQSAAVFLRLLVNVAITVAGIHVLFWIVERAQGGGTETPEGDPQSGFLRRLPLPLRGPLVRLEAQDHYLNVVTTRGSQLILMRLGEAVAELRGAGGLMVHRSHWVALDRVVGHRREGGRDLLEMEDGAMVPVSRSNRAAAQEAGLF